MIGGGERYTLTWKVEDSARTISKLMIISRKGNRGPACLVPSLDDSLAERGLRESIFIWIWLPGFSCWTDTILGHKENDCLAVQLTEKLCASKWDTVGLRVFYKNALSACCTWA